MTGLDAVIAAIDVVEEFARGAQGGTAAGKVAQIDPVLFLRKETTIRNMDFVVAIGLCIDTDVVRVHRKFLYLLLQSS